MIADKGSKIRRGRTRKSITPHDMARVHKPDGGCHIPEFLTKTGDFTNYGGRERNGELVLKKSPSWCLRGRQQQGYKQTRVSDAAGNRHSRRLAAYDGATRPFGVAVLLLPHRRSGSSKPLVTFHRPLRQLRFCA